MAAATGLPEATLAPPVVAGEDVCVRALEHAALDREALQAEGMKHEYHLYPGDHSLTYFLSHMGEVMEFHSRAFAEHK